MSEITDRILDSHDLRKTRVRREVLHVFLQSKKALGNKEIETHFDQLDRITLYRTLRTFEDHGIIHKAIDGSDRPKFALCSVECTEEEHRDDHAHFHCEQCGKTLCLEEVETPDVHAPNGIQVTNTHVVLTGLCKDCSN